MNRRIYILLVVLLVLSSWWLGKPGNPPPLPIVLSGSKNTQVLGSETDKMPPVSRFTSTSIQALKGDTMTGDASDLGSGVAQVVVQIQRISDGLVWNGQSWGENVGEITPVALKGLKFEYIIPTELKSGERYIFRSQAIDFAGNVQTKWDEVIVTGSENPKEI